VLSATVTGFAFAAARLHVGSIWGLAVVHALGNFCNDISAGVPLWAYLVVDALIFAYG
jgi:membrane protease YdiL (CAAX protease family)